MIRSFKQKGLKQFFRNGTKSGIQAKHAVKLRLAHAEIMKNKISSSANKKILFLPHAIMRMSYSERMITTAEVREAVLLGEVIEEYPADRRGASCSVSFVKQDQALHVVCAPKSA